MYQTNGLHSDKFCCLFNCNTHGSQQVIKTGSLQKREFFENSKDINFNNQNDKIDTKLNENIEQNIEQNNGLIDFNNANT